MHPLDNPVWHSLIGPHSSVAIAKGGARRYDPQTLPFGAIESPSATLDLVDLLEVGETIMVGGVIPSGSGLQQIDGLVIQQFVWSKPNPQLDDVRVIALGAEHIPAMVALTAEVYPTYFRERTATLGPYWGVFQNGQLVAMAGVRMTLDDFEEVSGVVVREENRGQGLGSAVTLAVVSNILSRGKQPFLHTEDQNVVAGRLYERLGFEWRTIRHTGKFMRI